MVHLAFMLWSDKDWSATHNHTDAGKQWNKVTSDSVRNMMQREAQCEACDANFGNMDDFAQGTSGQIHKT